MILHAGLIAARHQGRWAGVLIRGPSGSGKSDLALRALEAGFRLVADDRVVVWASGLSAYGRAPGVLDGLIEARGLDVVRAPALGFAPIVLVVDCVGEPPERLPEPAWTPLAGVRLPCLALMAREASALAKLRRGLDHLGTLRQAAYQAGLAANAARDGGLSA